MSYQITNAATEEQYSIELKEGFDGTVKSYNDSFANIVSEVVSAYYK